MRKSLFVITLGFLVSTARAQITEEEDVLVLTTDNFDEAIDAHKFVMVEFYAPWCGHCKALAPEYSKAARLLKEENSKMRLAKMDAEEHRQKAIQWGGVGSYPTIKFFRSGQPIPYNKGRTSEAIISWMKKKSGPPATNLASIDDTKKFIEDKEIVIVGFFSDPKETEATEFLNTAEIMDDMGPFSFGITSEPDVSESYDVKGDGIVLFKPFDEGRNDFKGTPFTVENIKRFITSNSLPLLVDFNPKYAARVYMESSRNGALYLFVSSTSDEYSSQKELAEKIANENKGKMLTIIMDSDNEDNHRFLNLLGVQGPPFRELPTMRFAYGWSRKFVPESTEITEDNIKQFVKDAVSKKAKEITWSKSEEIPDDWDKEPVKVLVGKSLHQFVKKVSNVFVEFYAPWCGHCKALTPIWEELGKKFKDRTDITIAKLEATSNTPDSVHLGGYPTLILFTGGSVSNQHKYQGERTLDDLLDFLKKHKIKSEVKPKKKDKKKKKDEL